MSEDTDGGQIDEEVRAFLHARIESFEQLETLLFLRQHRDRTWSPQAVAEELKIQHPDAEAALEHLSRNDLLNVRVRGEVVLFEYSPRDSRLAEAVDRLSRAYDESRLEIMRFMSKNAIERVRTRALHLFADAFVLGRKKDG